MVTVQRGAMLVLDLQDQFAQKRGLSGSYPRPLGRFRFLLAPKTDGDTGAPARLASPWEMNVVVNPSGFYLFFGDVTHPDGSRRRVDQPGGTLRVESEYYQTFEQKLSATPGTSGTAGNGASSPISILLAPGPAYPFPDQPPAHPGGRLRGTLRRADGCGIAGACVKALDDKGNAQPIAAVSGKDGQWVAVLPAVPATGLVKVLVTFPDGTIKTADGVPVKRDVENNLPQAMLRGTVRRKSAGVAGAVVRVSSMQGTEIMTDEDGNWVCYLDVSELGGQVTITAQLPNSRTKKSSAAMVIARKTVTVPVFEF